MRKLAGTTTLVDEAGLMHTFQPGTSEDELPYWAEGKINNESAWAEEEDGNYGGEGYDSHTVPQLVQMVQERGIEVAGTKKADLIEALEADDEDGDNN